MCCFYPELFTGQGQVIAPEEDNSFSEDAEIEAGMKKQRRPALPRTKNDQIPEWEKVRLYHILKHNCIEVSTMYVKLIVTYCEYFFKSFLRPL